MPSDLEKLVAMLKDDARGCDSSFCGRKPYTPCPRCCRVQAAAGMLGLVMDAFALTGTVCERFVERDLENELNALAAKALGGTDAK